MTKKTERYSKKQKELFDELLRLADSAKIYGFAYDRDGHQIRNKLEYARKVREAAENFLQYLELYSSPAIYEVTSVPCKNIEYVQSDDPDDIEREVSKWCLEKKYSPETASTTKPTSGWKINPNIKLSWQEHPPSSNYCRRVLNLDIYIQNLGYDKNGRAYLAAKAIVEAHRLERAVKGIEALEIERETFLTMQPSERPVKLPTRVSNSGLNMVIQSAMDFEEICTLVRELGEKSLANRKKAKDPDKTVWFLLARHLVLEHYLSLRSKSCEKNDLIKSLPSPYCDNSYPGNYVYGYSIYLVEGRIYAEPAFLEDEDIYEENTLNDDSEDAPISIDTETFRINHLSPTLQDYDL